MIHPSNIKSCHGFRDDFYDAAFDDHRPDFVPTMVRVLFAFHILRGEEI